MRLLNLDALFAGLAAGKRVLGIDPGARLIGVALSDPTRMLASPYATLARGKLAVNAAEISAIAARENVGGMVVGWPLSMDGTVGPAAQGARDWALALAAATGIPTALQDERLSSAAVNRMLIGEADLSRGKRAKAVDRAAAAYMLQGALDAALGGRRELRPFTAIP